MKRHLEIKNKRKLTPYKIMNRYFSIGVVMIFLLATSLFFINYERQEFAGRAFDYQNRENPDIYEPDNIIAEAQEIQLFEIQQHTFSESDIDDHLKIELEKGMSYNVYTYNLDNANTVIYIFNNDSERIEPYYGRYDDKDPENEDFSSSTYIKAEYNGTYYIQVRNKLTGLQGSYSVIVKETSDAWEYDDTTGYEKIQSLGIKRTRNIGYPDDVDRIEPNETKKDKALVVELSEYEIEPRVKVWIFDGSSYVSEEDIFEYQEEDKKRAIFQAISDDPNDHHIEISNNVTDSEHFDYDILLRYPEKDIYDGFDFECEGSTYVELGRSYRHIISDFDDKDYMNILAQEGHTYFVYIDDLKDTETSIEIYDGCPGTKIQSIAGDEKTKAGFTADSTKNYYILIQGTDVEGRYNATIEDIADEYEDLDDDYRNETKNYISDIQSHTVSKEYDIDWMIFNATFGDIYNLSITGYDSDEDLNVAVFDEKGRISEIEFKETNGTIIFEALYSGEYHISVAGTNIGDKYNVNVENIGRFVDNFEKDNEKQGAKTISLNLLQERKVSYLDTDWIRFESNKGDSYEISYEGDSFGVRMYDEYGTRLPEIRNTTNLTSYISASQNETFFFINSSDEFANKEYDLTVKKINEDFGVVADENIVLDNNIEGKGFGIMAADDNIVIDCNKHIINGEEGLGIGLNLNGRNNVTVKNCVFKGLYLGLSIKDAYDNLIFNNQFEDNDIHVTGNIENNSFNTEPASGTNILGIGRLGGNFWDDYLGFDNDGDGLGDTELPHYNDNHPLVPDVTCIPGQVEECSTDTGVCSTGTRTCKEDQKWDVCVDALGNPVIIPGQNEEKCDGLDNDCDNEIDEGFLDIDDDGTKDCVDEDADGDGKVDTIDNIPIDKIIGASKDINSINFEAEFYVGSEKDPDNYIPSGTDYVQDILIKENNKVIAVIPFDFSKQIYLPNLTIEKQNNGEGYLLLKGIDTAFGESKTFYIDKTIENQTTICIKDIEIEGIEDISSGCDEEYEEFIDCTSSSVCSIVDDGERFMITELSNTAVREQCKDSDNDGYGVGCYKGEDCNDNNSNINPDANDICGNGIDEDCNGFDESCIYEGKESYSGLLSGQWQEVELKVKDWITLEYNGESYEVELLSITAGAGLDVSGVTDSITLGNSKKYNLNDDDMYDLEIYVIDKKEASVTLKIRNNEEIIPVEENCFDNVKNQDESDVDCGGSCKACEDGKICMSDTDCYNICIDGTCSQQETCYDGILNQDEEEVDCGGVCPPCEKPLGKSPVLWVTLVIVMILLGAGGFAGYKYYGEYLKKEEDREVAEDFEKIKNYVWQLQEEGKTLEEIKMILLRKGWDPELTDKVLLKVESYIEENELKQLMGMIKRMDLNNPARIYSYLTEKGYPKELVREAVNRVLKDAKQ